MTNNTRTCGCDWICGCTQRQAKDKWETSPSVKNQLRDILVDCGQARDWKRWPSDLALKALADSWESVAHTQPHPARTKGGECPSCLQKHPYNIACNMMKRREFLEIFQKGRLMENKGTN